MKTSTSTEAAAKALEKIQEDQELEPKDSQTAETQDASNNAEVSGDIVEEEDDAELQFDPAEEVANLEIGEAETDENDMHPLERSWTMWFMNGAKPKQDPKKGGNASSGWNQGLIELANFGTIEEFWAIQHHIQVPSKLALKNDYMLFQRGVRPEWEDEANKGGGMWKMILPNKLRTEQLDRMWVETLLSMVGEYYGELGDLICGAYLQRRQREDRIQLWTTKGTEKQIREIGRIFKQAINLSSESQMHYLKHDDQAKSTSWIVKQTGALYKI